MSSLKRDLLQRVRLHLDTFEERLTPATITWTGAGSDALWSNTGNWLGAVAPTGDGTDDLVFTANPANLTSFNDLASAKIKSIRFDGGGYFLNGNALFLGKNGLTATNLNGQTQFNITMSMIDGPTTINNISKGSQLLFNAPMLTANNTLTINGAGLTQFTQDISGTDDVIINGPGITQWFSSNQFSGTTRVLDGSLYLSAALGLGDTIPLDLVIGNDVGASKSALVSINQSFQTDPQQTQILILSDGELNLGGDTTAVLQLTMGSSLGGGFVTGEGAIGLGGDVIIHASPDGSEISAPLNLLTGDRHFLVEDGAAEDLRLTGAISGSGNLVKQGAGQVRISATNNFTGIAQIEAGQIFLEAPSNSIPGRLVIGSGVGGSAIVSLSSGNQFPATGLVGINSNGELNLNGFDTTVDQLTGTGTITFGNSTLSIGTANGSSQFTGTINGIGNLVKTGSGTFNLAGDSTFTGPLVINDGTLVVSGNASNNPVELSKTSTLSGTGSVGEINGKAGGRVRPKSAEGGPGILTSGPLTLSSASVFDVTINGPIAGTEYSQVDVTGAVTLSGAKLDVHLLSTYTPTVGTKFQIITNDGTDSVIGSFAGLNESAVFSVDGKVFSISYQGGTGNDVVLTRVASSQATNTILISSKSTSTVGEAVTLTATVSVANGTGLPTGTIEFRDDTTVIGTATVGLDGRAAITVTNLPTGARNLVAFYRGDQFFARSFSLTFTQTVNPAPVQPITTSTTVTSSQNPSVQGQFIQLTALVVANDIGNPFVTGTVSFFDGVRFLDTAPVSNGIAVISLNTLGIGFHPITAQYSGDINYVAGTSPVFTQQVDGGVGPIVPPVTPPTPPVVPPVVPPVFPPPPTPPPITPPVVPPVTPPVVPPTVPTGIRFAAGRDAGSPQAFTFSSGALTSFSGINGDPRFNGGTRISTGDLTGDGIADTIVAAGPGSVPIVRVFDGSTGSELYSFLAYEEGFSGGVFVTSADITGDGRVEIIASADEGGGPRVRIFDGVTQAVVADFFGIEDPDFRGGTRVGAGDINGDGIADVVVGAGFGGGPRLAIFDGASLRTNAPVKLVADFFVFEQTLRNGVYVTVGDLNGDGSGDIIVGGGPGGGPRVFAISGKDLLNSNGTQQTQLANFFAGNSTSRGGIRVSAKNLDGDKFADIVVGSGIGTAPVVQSYLGKNIPTDGTPTFSDSYAPFDDLSRGGVYVG